ncbi:MAG: putative Beta-lactamase domain protein [Chloroflexi bacterium]|nr:putative Beta-lactamase domain protein [Chloroflexota bacterium]
MAKLILLGTANAVPNERQENTHMALVGETRTVLIDASTNPIVRLRQGNIAPLSLTDLILTHFHPDHVSGVPLLLLDSWLLGRKEPLNIYGLSFTIDRVEKMMDLYGWQHWPGFFQINFIRLPEKEMAPVLQSDEFVIYASPVHHMIPNIGLRIEFKRCDQVVAYSCDTEPAEEVVRLAAGADLLLHEATGAEQGHSSAAQAGSIARQAEAGRLVLIHFDSGDNAQTLLDGAQSTFPGPVELAYDLMEFEFE